MSISVNKLLSGKNLNGLVATRKQGFADYQKLNLYLAGQSEVGKFSRFGAWPASDLVVAFLISQPTKSFLFPPNYDGRRAQIPASPTQADFGPKSVDVGTETEAEADLEKEFNVLVAQWREDTFFYSSLTKQFSHPAYVRIMAMGKEGISLVLREMQKSQDNWFYALRFMAGEDVSKGTKDFDEAKTAWIEWGYKHNYI